MKKKFLEATGKRNLHKYDAVGELMVGYTNSNFEQSYKLFSRTSCLILSEGCGYK
jgi:hypothetical protein